MLCYEFKNVLAKYLFSEEFGQLKLTKAITTSGACGKAYWIYSLISSQDEGREGATMIERDR
uniref:Uncharacterized protein n=1 Tax=uncultured bacterium A1Q1_fos_1815 TaxID=1256553 RepID=L7VV80_9BACT|nr:hypothetical protein [uncultured bacterium A1Q1_fos_1815]